MTVAPEWPLTACGLPCYRCYGYQRWLGWSPSLRVCPVSAAHSSSFTHTHTQPHKGVYSKQWTSYEADEARYLFSSTWILLFSNGYVLYPFPAKYLVTGCTLSLLLAKRYNCMFSGRLFNMFMQYVCLHCCYCSIFILRRFQLPQEVLQHRKWSKHYVLTCQATRELKPELFFSLSFVSFTTSVVPAFFSLYVQCACDD